MKTKLWTEDECTRNTSGHEGLLQAWTKLFGREETIKNVSIMVILWNLNMMFPAIGP